MQIFSRRFLQVVVLSLAFLFCIATTIASPAQTFTTLYTFCPQSGCTDGWSPVGLVQATDGNLYGATWFGGASSACGTDGCGTLFKVTTGGTLTTLHSFDGTDGAVPDGAVQATNGTFYGTTTYGGASSACGTDGCGTIFKITTGGTLSTLHNFDFADGSRPNAVVQATDGNFYGTTWIGGANSCVISGTDNGCGTVFKITAGGTLTTLHSFDASEGAGPLGGLVQSTNGNFYGTTRTPPGGEGGAYGYGTVFEITSSGTLTTLHRFDGTDGAYPYAGLVQATDGNLYGTTTNGGANNVCTSGGCGTVFKITPAGAFTTLYSFCTQPNCTDGAGPFGLVQATDGNLYGATAAGGNISDCNSQGCGTLFKISTGGKLTTLHTFDGTDGASPLALVQVTNGKFYGVTTGGANNNCPQNPTTDGAGCGTVFSLSVGLSAFPRVTLSTTSLSFGNEVLDETSAAKTVTATSTGSATLDISSITASGNFAISANTCGATLAVKKNCKVSVTFTPKVLGKLTGTLMFTDNAPNSPQAVALSGTGIEPATLTPASATYAAQKVGTTSAAKTFTLTNNQTVTLASVAISTTGEFAVSAKTCTTSLAAKEKCTISVTFTPKATGTRTGKLSVSDSASNSPQTSSLTGTGN